MFLLSFFQSYIAVKNPYSYQNLSCSLSMFEINVFHEKFRMFQRSDVAFIFYFFVVLKAIKTAGSIFIAMKTIVT